MKARPLIKTPGRRELLVKTATTALVMAMPTVLSAQDNLAVTPLRNDIFLISGAGTNVLVAIGSEAVVLVDGGQAAHSTALMAEVDRLSGGKPVMALFNSNWRPEHCGLNAMLGPRGTRIIAHENTRLWQGNDFYVNWEDRHYSPAPVQANETFYTSGSIMLDDEVIAYGRAGDFRTDGDIYIHFENSNVIYAGDMLGVSTYPVLDYVTGGWINGAREATDRMLEIVDAQTLVIPAEGAPVQRDALERQQEMLEYAYEQVANAYRTGRSLEQFRATEPMADFNARYGDPALFEELLYRGAWYHVTGRAIPGII